MADLDTSALDQFVVSPTPTPVPTPMPGAGASANLSDDVPMTAKPAASPMDTRRFTDRHPWLSGAGGWLADTVGQGVGATIGAIESAPLALPLAAIGYLPAAATAIETGDVVGSAAGGALLSNPAKVLASSIVNSADRAIYPKTAQAANDHWSAPLAEAKGRYLDALVPEAKQGAENALVGRALGLGYNAARLGPKARFLELLGYSPETVKALKEAGAKAVTSYFKPGSKQAEQLIALNKNNLEAIYDLPPRGSDKEFDDATQWLVDNGFFDRVAKTVREKQAPVARTTWNEMAKEIGGRTISKSGAADYIEGRIPKVLDDIVAKLKSKRVGGVSMEKPVPPPDWQAVALKRDGTIDLEQLSKLKDHYDTAVPTPSAQLRTVLQGLEKNLPLNLSPEEKAQVINKIQQEILQPSASDLETLNRAKRVFQAAGADAYGPSRDEASAVDKAYASVASSLRQAEIAAAHDISPKAAGVMAALNGQYSLMKKFEPAINYSYDAAANMQKSVQLKNYGPGTIGSIKDYVVKTLSGGEGSDTMPGRLARWDAARQLDVGQDVPPYSMMTLNGADVLGIRSMQGGYRASGGFKVPLLSPKQAGEGWQASRDTMIRNLFELAAGNLAFSPGGLDAMSEMTGLAEQLASAQSSDDFIGIVGANKNLIERTTGEKSPPGTTFGLVTSDQIPGTSRQIAQKVLSGKLGAKEGLKAMSDLMDYSRAPK